MSGSWPPHVPLHPSRCCCICPKMSPHLTFSSCFLLSPALRGVPESLNPFQCSFFIWCAFPCDPCIHAAAGFLCRSSLVVQCEWHRSDVGLSGVTTMLLLCWAGSLQGTCAQSEHHHQPLCMRGNGSPRGLCAPDDPFFYLC